MALLANGDYEAGWVVHEARWGTTTARAAAPRFTAPQWRGEPAAGRTILIFAEQGHGDTLQFCRFASTAAERGLRVILEVQGPLERLMRSLHGVDTVVPIGGKLPSFDLQCATMSLPLALGTTLDSLPDRMPYLHADPNQAAMWRERLAATAGLRIGLVWAGNPRKENFDASLIDRRRSLPPELLAPLFDVPGVQFFSLQKGGPPPPSSSR